MTEEKVIVKNKVHVLSNVKELFIDKSNKPQTYGVFSAEDKEDLPSTDTTPRAGDEDVKHSLCEKFTNDGKNKSTNKMFSSTNEPSILIIEASMIADKFLSSVSEISTTDDKSSINGTSAVENQNKVFIRKLLPIENEVKLSVSEILLEAYRNRLSHSETSLPSHRETSSEMEISTVNDIVICKSSVNLCEQPSVEIEGQKNTGFDQILPESRKEQIAIWIKTMAIFTFVFGAVSCLKILKCIYNCAAYVCLIVCVPF